MQSVFRLLPNQFSTSFQLQVPQPFFPPTSNQFPISFQPKWCFSRSVRLFFKTEITKADKNVEAAAMGARGKKKKKHTTRHDTTRHPTIHFWDPRQGEGTNHFFMLWSGPPRLGQFFPPIPNYNSSSFHNQFFCVPISNQFPTITVYHSKVVNRAEYG